MRINLPQFSIEKALEFVGDNSSYQKKRLLVLSIVIVTIAMLTARMSFLGQGLTVLFLFASGVGQIVCPIYFSLRTMALGIGGFCLFGMAVYPISQFLMDFAYCGMGFFGRGFFVSSLIYINEIGGDKFRAWATIVVFGIWGLSPLLESLEKIFNVPGWLWVYLCVLVPFFIGSFFVLSYWKPSPFHLATKRQFAEAKEVLNEMASENNRSFLPYGLQGEIESDELAVLTYKKPTYLDVIYRPIIRRITLPLMVLWIYRQYIYFGSYIILPQLGNQISKNLILLSVSETVAVLMSYPIRIKIKRVNAFFGFTLLIAASSLLSSFTILGDECMEKGYVCATKYIYRVSIMLIRFSITLIGNILISYTLEVYPANVRSLGFSLCIGVSSVGSTLMPWINSTFISISLSGFISFTIASAVALYFITELRETYGRMNTESLQEMQNSAPMVSLRNWATLSFG